MSDTPRVLGVYRDEVVPKMMGSMGVKSAMAVPRLERIVLNMGVGETVADRKALDAAVAELALISGQKPAITVARKSIAGFKIRKGFPIGCKVTLRRRRMYDFFDRLVTVVLPRTRDFRGLPSRSFDGRGNYSLGIREQIAFPEVEYEKAEAVRGLDVTIVTSTGSDEHAREFLTLLGLPLRGT